MRMNGFKALEAVRIILVESEGAGNVGAVARIMKNMGLRDLVLVNPQCDAQGDQAQRMAVHAKQLLLDAPIVQTLPAALVGCERAIATTARHHRHLQINAQSPRQVLPWLLTGGPTALIFGPESHGLSNQDLNMAQKHLYIPTSADYAALNLAQAVTVCCYELRQSVLAQDCASEPPVATSSIPTSGPSSPADAEPIAPLEQMEAYYQQLETLLLETGFLYPHTAAPRMMKLRRLYGRASLTVAELAMLRGMLRQINWKINQRD